MISLKINNIKIEAEEGTSILQAAQKLDIEIPTMCYYNDKFSNHPSCMVCVVKNLKNNQLIPSCAIKIEEGMDILTNDDEIYKARKDALELLLSDHVGDCEAPCRVACPAYMDIPEMNRLISEGKFHEALVKVKEEIALPLILGYICPAPCENACRRKQIDEPVSICMLKRFVAAEDSSDDHSFMPDKQDATNKKVAIIGSGPAGLATAFYLLKMGHEVHIFDKNEKAGGTLRYAELNNELPEDVLNTEINYLIKYGVQFVLQKNVDKEFFHNNLKKEYNAIVLASGEYGISNLQSFELKYEYNKSGVIVDRGTYQTSEDGIFACGNVLRTQKMAVRSVAQGKSTALAVNQYLLGKDVDLKDRKFNSKFGKLYSSEFDEYLKEASHDTRLKPEKGHLSGFLQEEAIKEAMRCMHCDCRAKDNCKLRDHADEYKADRKKYWPEQRKLIVKSYTHESIIYEPEKCIKCGICVEITENERELTGLSYVGRGFTVQINVPFNEDLKKVLLKTAKKCADACPTGAIELKSKLKSNED